MNTQSRSCESRNTHTHGNITSAHGAAHDTAIDDTDHLYIYKVKQRYSKINGDDDEEDDDETSLLAVLHDGHEANTFAHEAFSSDDKGRIKDNYGQTWDLDEQQLFRGRTYLNKEKSHISYVYVTKTIDRRSTYETSGRLTLNVHITPTIYTIIETRKMLLREGNKAHWETALNIVNHYTDRGLANKRASDYSLKLLKPQPDDHADLIKFEEETAPQIRNLLKELNLLENQHELFDVEWPTYGGKKGEITHVYVEQGVVLGPVN